MGMEIFNSVADHLKHLFGRRELPFALGARKDPEDDRDYLLGSFLDKRAPMPDEVRYDQFCSPAGSQGKLSSCVAWAAGHGVKEAIDRKNNEWTDLSVLWLYDRCKHIDGDPNREGTYIRAAMKILAKQGCAPEIYLPYDSKYEYGKYDREIDIIPEMFVRPFRIKTYARLKNVDEMRLCLDQNGPFAMGIEVTDDVLNASPEGMITITQTKKTDGGHAIAVVGYNDTLSCFRILNSWSTMWGDNGLAWLPYEYWDELGLDSWGIVDISPNEA